MRHRLGLRAVLMDLMAGVEIKGYDDEESHQQAIQRFRSVGLNAFQPQNIISLLQTIISEVAQN